MNQAAQNIPISVIILTLNEQQNIAPCIRCLQDFDEVIVVDSSSNDDTANCARSARPDVRVLENPFENFGQQRNWAIDSASPRNDWVLFVDADEFCTTEFIDEVRNFINQTDCIGAYVAGRNFFLGKWLKYSTMFPSYQLRLLKVGFVRYEKAGHGQREVLNGKAAYLVNGWRHEGFSKGLADWISRHNKYSTEEVALIAKLRKQKLDWQGLLSRDPIKRRRSLRLLSVRVPFTPVLMFLYAYVFRFGFLDGAAGLTYCSLIMAHQAQVVAKVREAEYHAIELESCSD